MNRVIARTVDSIRRHPVLWGGAAAAAVAAVVLWPRDDAPSFFTDEEIALLNNGGSISSERFAGYDMVCLFGQDSFGYGDGNTCVETGWPRLAIQKKGICETYSLRGLRSNVLSEYSFRCRRVEDGFELRVAGGVTLDFDR